MLLNFFGDSGDFLQNAFGGSDEFSPAILSASPTRIELSNPATGYRTVLLGTGLPTDPESQALTGTVTGFEVYGQSDRFVAEVENIAWPLATFVAGVEELVDSGSDNTPTLDGLLNRQDITVDASTSTTPANFFLDTVTSDVTLLGSQFDDGLGGGAGDDTIRPGAGVSGEYVAGSGGTDQIDFTGHTATAFAQLDYSLLGGAVQAVIAPDTGTVVKSGGGTDTLVALQAVLQGDGFGLLGTELDDRFVLDGGEESFLGVVGGPGNDSFDLTLSGTLRLDYSGSFGAIDADLAGGSVADGFGNTDTVAITAGAGQLELRGSDFADTILGSDADERFILRAGNDTLDAGGGTDLLRYDRSGVSDGIAADLTAGQIQLEWDGQAFIHTVSNVEEVLGTVFADAMTASADGSVLRGRGGNDTLTGGLETDVLRGGDGDDVLDPGDSASFDDLDPGSGEDTIDSSAMQTGFLFVQHFGLVDTNGFTIDVDGVADTGTIGKGDNGTTILTGIRAAMDADGVGLQGSNLDDVFNVTVSANGFAVLRGGAGNDTFNLGASSGALRLEFGSGAVLEPATQGMRADLAAGTISNDGFGGQDSISELTGVRYEIRATAFQDVIVGAEGTDGMVGRGGDDVLDGRGGRDVLLGVSGADRLTGGAGGDILFGGSGDDVLFGDALPVSAVPEIAGQVYRLYQATLDREPDAGGLQGWAEILVTGQNTLLGIVPGFVNSPEFQARYGALSDEAFITQLYRNVLDRDPDGSGLQGWLDVLALPENDRADVILGFSQSLEFRADTAGVAAQFAADHTVPEWQDDVFRLYQATLDRAPDLGGFLAWVEELGGGRDYLEVADGFVGSQEFENRYGALSDSDFVAQLYRNVLGREGSGGEIQSWLDEIAGGADRTDAVRGFAQSQEFRNATAADLEAWIRGQDVSDVLEGGSGSNLLAGGVLSDRFVFDPNVGGQQRVLDLEAWDALDLSAFGYADAAAARGQFSQSDADLVFADQGVTAIFPGTGLAAITDDMLLI